MQFLLQLIDLALQPIDFLLRLLSLPFDFSQLNVGRMDALVELCDLGAEFCLGFLFIRQLRLQRRHVLVDGLQAGLVLVDFLRQIARLGGADAYPEKGTAQQDGRRG
ncbi:hypothetical protein [Acidithiobacillus sp. AMEEHan]|uniref:hypothetical protein n=1 Tax=Acidithiobacillus sp. AMEEHan TaxID=2994951 RepID=UPI0027E41FD5|nr:hypothetical protein [Acidithiobacillus sp. AMEEHan]